MSVEEKLAQGIKEAKLPIDERAQHKLLSYLALLDKWNRVHNLTAIRDPLEMVTLHLLDSLVVMPFMDVKRLLDVGSGAGLPGIPLAITLPNLEVTVIDSNKKKVSFMRQVKAELGLENLTVLEGRVEDLSDLAPFDGVISRAFSDMVLFVSLTRHLCHPTGQWFAMKGVFPESELKALEDAMHMRPRWVKNLNVPGLAAQRHLVCLPALKQ
jgi:16S rRNA (guanine527-N7)-methyltransferase